MVKIISDSSCMMSVAEGAKINVDVIPLQITINNKTYSEYEELDSETMYGLIKEGHLPTSSQPPVGVVCEHMEMYDECIDICMADGLSGTYQSALMARDMAKNKEKVHVLNCKTLCGPQQYLVEKAVKLADAGKTVEEILSALNESINACHSFLMPSDFQYLKRGGRMTPLAATMGGLLKINPMIRQTKDGMRLDKFHIARTFSSVADKLVAEFKKVQIDENYIIYVSHAAAVEKCNMVVKKLKEEFSNIEMKIINLSPAMITQGGPGCVAVQVIRK